MDSLDGLVDSARAGGDWAFGRLWEQLSGQVAGYLRARGVVDVDDVTSDVFLAAFQGMSSFDGNGDRFRSWLFTIAHHRSVDGVRMRVRTPLELTYEPESDRRTMPSAEDAATANLADAEMLALLGRLTPEQREVVALRFVADLGLHEVAEITGRSLAAVKQLQRRGTDALRRFLDEESSARPISSLAVVAITEST